MDIITSLGIIGVVALVHASFQLSVSVLTMLGTHTLGAKFSKKKSSRLMFAYIVGSAVMTLLLLSFALLLVIHLIDGTTPLMAWAIASGLGLGIGIAIWLFYYKRNNDGTTLWIPRAFARHLANRSKQTKSSVEAFSLGLTTVLSEIVFIIPTVTIAALITLELPQQLQLSVLVIYTLISIMGLLIVWAIIGGGKSISKVQKWRENNKKFLQFAAGGALIAASMFIYVSKIVAEASGVL